MRPFRRAISHVLAFDSVTFVRGSKTLERKTQLGLQPHRLAIPHEVAEHFNILDIRVNGKSCLVASPISAMIFSDLVLSNEVVLPPGNHFEISVSCVKKGPKLWQFWKAKSWFRWWVLRVRGVRFIAALIGPVVG